MYSQKSVQYLWAKARTLTWKTVVVPTPKGPQDGEWRLYLLEWEQEQQDVLALGSTSMTSPLSRPDLLLQRSSGHACWSHYPVVMTLAIMAIAIMIVDTAVTSTVVMWGASIIIIVPAIKIHISLSCCSYLSSWLERSSWLQVTYFNLLSQSSKNFLTWISTLPYIPDIFFRIYFSVPALILGKERKSRDLGVRYLLGAWNSHTLTPIYTQLVISQTLAIHQAGLSPNLLLSPCRRHHTRQRVNMRRYWCEVWETCWRHGTYQTPIQHPLTPLKNSRYTQLVTSQTVNGIWTSRLLLNIGGQCN